MNGDLVLDALVPTMDVGVATCLASRRRATRVVDVNLSNAIEVLIARTLLSNAMRSLSAENLRIETRSL